MAMPIARVLFLLAVGLLLGGSAARAQQAPGPKPVPAKALPRPKREQRTLTVNLPLPSLVARLGEAVGLLERSGSKKGRAGAATPEPDDPVLTLTLPLPKLFDSKPATPPATP